MVEKIIGITLTNSFNGCFKLIFNHLDKGSKNLAYFFVSRVISMKHECNYQ